MSLKMCHTLLTAFLLATSVVVSACEEEALAESPAGFFLAIGGGASTVETAADSKANSVLTMETGQAKRQLKESQVLLHRAGLEALNESRRLVRARGGEPVPSGVCHIEYRQPGADTDDALATSQALFVAAGAPSQTFQGFVFPSKSKANNLREVDILVRQCGLVSLPGGDQTAMRALWEHTRLQDALKTLVNRGGGIMGKSAGAALQGTLGYFPNEDSATTAFSFLQGLTLGKRELDVGFFANTAPGLPRFYVETHAGDRERSARALALLAAWEERKPVNETPRALALVVDSDTGVLIRYDTALAAWAAEVTGARAVEVLLPTINSISQAGHSVLKGGERARPPTYTNVTSHLLLHGARFVLSGPRQGAVLKTSSRVLFPTPKAPFSNSSDPSKGAALLRAASCGEKLEGRIVGRFESDGERNGVVSFDAYDPSTHEHRALSEVEYAYLTGDLRARRENGCGFWMTDAFDPEVGRPENRLNAQRYALGLGLPGADFSFALSAGMVATVRQEWLLGGQRTDTVTLETEEEPAASAFLYDVAQARDRGISNYTYLEMNARGPVQTGHWLGGVTHLLPPGASFNLTTRRVFP